MTRRAVNQGANQVVESDLRLALKDLEEQSVIGMFKHHKNPLIRYTEVTD